jgi:hypothetical protein
MEMAMRYCERSEASGALVLVLVGNACGSVAFGMAIEEGLGTALIQAATAGGLGMFVAGLWRGLTHGLGLPKNPKSL